MSNSTIQLMLSGNSNRHFAVNPQIKDEDFQQILKAVQQSPNSFGAQQTSLLVVDQPELLSKVAEITNNPHIAKAAKFIIVIGDFYKTNHAVELGGKKQEIHNNFEGTLVLGVDAGITVAFLEMAIKSFGYGSTVVGGVRSNPQALIELLNLPKYTFPMVGITIGAIDEQYRGFVSPRAPLNSYVYFNQYDTKLAEQGVVEYNNKLNQFYQQNSINTDDFITKLSKTYSINYYPLSKGVMQKQGFNFI